MRLHPYRLKKLLLFIPFVLGSSMNSSPLLAQQKPNKNENLSPMPNANFLEYLGSAIKLDGDTNIIEPMELNELDQLGLLSSLNKKIETNQDLATMKKLSLKPEEDK